MMKKSSDNFITVDAGFTLVELVICVTILAIASVVLMKSFSLAAMTNGKAQKMQNATSLAESVMEEVKSSSIVQLQERYNAGADKTIGESDTTFAGFTAQIKDSTAKAAAGTGATSAFLRSTDANTQYYVLWKEGAFVGQSSDIYDVTATMRTVPYKGTEGEADASDANSLKLPVIEEIDTHTKTVLTSKELNKYDVIAKDYFYDHTVTPGYKPLKSKEIIINKTGNGEAYKSEVAGSGLINVECWVSYKDEDDTEYRKKVFEGTYVSKKEGGAQKKVDNGIYIFYKRFLASDEKITINDSSSNDDHKVYVLFQGTDSLAGTTITITDGSDTKIGPLTSNGAVKYTDGITGEVINGRVNSGGYWLITNLPSNVGGTDGSMLEKKNQDRIFEVPVDVTKPGDSKTYATITSTVEVRK